MGLKELRKKKGVTQIDVSKSIGVSAVVYRLWEAGGGKPNKENGEKLEAYFGVPLEEIFGGKNK